MAEVSGYQKSWDASLVIQRFDGLATGFPLGNRHKGNSFDRPIFMTRRGFFVLDGYLITIPCSSSSINRF